MRIFQRQMEFVANFFQSLVGTSKDSASYDPLIGTEMNNLQKTPESQPVRSIEELVKSIHGSVIHQIDDDYIPSKFDFLNNTFISFYSCEFKEEIPHKVIWVLGHSELAEFLQHPRVKLDHKPIGKYFRKYGSIWQYPETVIQDAINEIELLCENFNLKLSDKESDDYNQNHVNEECVVETVSHMNGKSVLREMVECDKIEPHLKFIDDDCTFAEQIYDEAKYLMQSAGSNPERNDFFYNMSWSFVYAGTERLKLWWVPEKHAYSRLLAKYNTVSKIRTLYGTCFIYNDTVMENVITEAMKLCWTHDILDDDSELLK